jgi:pyruvate dehydrogenase kinase 2/3/4
MQRNDATMMCSRKYGDAPVVEINGRLDLTFPYIPTHLHYILLELLKNAMRATVRETWDLFGSTTCRCHYC